MVGKKKDSRYYLSGCQVTLERRSGRGRSSFQTIFGHTEVGLSRARFLGALRPPFRVRLVRFPVFCFASFFPSKVHLPDPRGAARGKKRTGEIGRGGSMTYDVPLHEPSRQPQ